MFNDFISKNGSGLSREHIQTFIVSNEAFSCTLGEVQISYKTYSENKGKDLVQIKKALKLAFQKAGMEKSEVEIDNFLKLASMTKNSALEVFSRVKNLK